jgi:hypothetical protein
VFLSFASAKLCWHICLSGSASTWQVFLSMAQFQLDCWVNAMYEQISLLQMNKSCLWVDRPIRFSRPQCGFTGHWQRAQWIGYLHSYRIWLQPSQLYVLNWNGALIIWLEIASWKVLQTNTKKINYNNLPPKIQVHLFVSSGLGCSMRPAGLNDL